MAEVETEIDQTVEAETIQKTITGMEVDITTTEIEVEIVETIVEIEIEAEEETDLIPEKEKEINSDLDQIKDTLTEFCNYCNRTGHSTHNCFRLENYLKRKGKKIVLHDDNDVE